ncbi:MAG: BBP7 family outer membrane beta-barrel protein [Pirellulaceae bacterium]
MIVASAFFVSLAHGQPPSILDSVEVTPANVPIDPLQPALDGFSSLESAINAAPPIKKPAASPSDVAPVVARQPNPPVPNPPVPNPPVIAAADPEPKFWLQKRKPRSRTYAQLDYLLWWAGDSELPSLLTTDPTGTPLADVGVTSSSRTIYGNETVGDWAHSGLRLRLGRSFSNSRLSRMELDLWTLFEGSDDFDTSSTGGTPILSRPFNNAQTGSGDAQIISYPGTSNGSFNAEYSRRAFGIDPTIFICLGAKDCRWLEFTTGYRYLNLQDELTLNEHVVLEPGGLIAPGTGFDVQDQFTATNQFHLWQIGLSHTEYHGDWLLNARGNLGLGAAIKEVEIEGSTVGFIGSTVTSTQSAGFLALHTNRGNHDETDFTVIPELNLNLQRRLGDNWTANVGYTVIFLADAVKAVDHVPTTIDPRNLPTPQPGAGPDPQFAFVNDDIWLHGLNFGLRYEF